MVSDLYHAVAVYREAVIAGGGNVIRENGKAFRRIEFRIVRPEMKDRLAGRVQKIPRKRQEIRRPCADGHNDDIAGKPVSILQHYSSHAAVPFIQIHESSALV